MRVPLVCRSCGQQQPVDLAVAGERIICGICEHESVSGDPGTRGNIQSQYGKTRFWTLSAGLAGFTALGLVVLRITWVESALPDSPLGTVLMAAAGLLFLASVACVVLAEQQREVVYF